jgi:hypothetical protein
MVPKIQQLERKSVMTENPLTIIFGCLATVLAIAGIILACLQVRIHIRKTTHEATHSDMENACPPPVRTIPGHRNSMAPRRPNRTNVLPMMSFDGLVLAFVSIPFDLQRLAIC